MDLLIFCFGHSSESDPDKAFDRNAIFSAFCSKCCSFYETFKCV